jgi:hypothetical protein
MAQVQILQAWEGPGLEPGGWKCGARQGIACQQQLRDLRRIDNNQASKASQQSGTP